MEHIPASEYTAANADSANRKADEALAKAIANEKKLDEIHTMSLAIMLGLFGEKNIPYWITKAKDFK